MPTGNYCNANWVPPHGTNVPASAFYVMSMLCIGVVVIAQIYVAYTSWRIYKYIRATFSGGNAAIGLGTMAKPENQNRIMIEQCQIDHPNPGTRKSQLTPTNPERQDQFIQLKPSETTGKMPRQDQRIQTMNQVSKPNVAQVSSSATPISEKLHRRDASPHHMDRISESNLGQLYNKPTPNSEKQLCLELPPPPPPALPPSDRRRQHELQRKRQRQERAIFQKILVIAATFAFTWNPYGLLIVAQLVAHAGTPGGQLDEALLRHLDAASALLGMSNATLNPILILCLNVRYRRWFWQWIKSWQQTVWQRGVCRPWSR